MITQRILITPLELPKKIILSMKVSILSVVFISISLTLFSQEERIIKINSLEQSNELQRSVFVNPSFTKGKMILKNEGLVSESKFNFNCLTNEMLFLNFQGDTLALANPENTSSVEIGLDTFYYYKNTFLLKITHYVNAPNLFIKQNMTFMGKQKKGAYGTYSSSSSINAAVSFNNENQTNVYLSADENLIYKFTTTFYLSDNLNKFVAATKSNFYKLYPIVTNQLNALINKEHPNFNKKADLLKMINDLKKLQPQ